MDEYRLLLSKESVKGEKMAWIFRWILYSVLLVLACVVYVIQGSIAGLYGMGMALTALVYNSVLIPVIRSKRPYPIVKYISVTMDIGLLTLYNFVDSAFNSPLSPVTNATLVLYPLLLFLASLRLDRALIVYASVTSVACMSGLYWFFYPKMDPAIASRLVSADPLGQVYRSFYMLMCGLMMLFIPRIVERLLKEQQKIFDESLEHLELARTDKLTGLANRRLLEEYLPAEIARCRRDGTSFAVLYMDLDDFKPVNDRYGHDAGDAVLVVVAQRLRNAVRTGDLVIRVGGDEFVIVVHAANSDAALDLLCSRIRESLREGIPLEREIASIDISIGRSSYPEDGDTGDRLIERADLDMLRRKAERKAPDA